MERFLFQQQDVIRSIERTIDNYKKMGVKLRTPAVTRSRLTILKERWTQCQILHADIKTVATTEQRTALPYFVEDDFSAAEENYLEAADFLAQALDEMEKPVTTYTPNVNSSTISECNPVAIPLPHQRKTLAKTQRCCYNCLGKGHFPSTCPSQKRCTHCQGKHHSLLHAESEPNSSKERPEASKADKYDVPLSDPKSTLALKVQIDKGPNPITTPVLLATARVLVSTNEGRALQIRALIDTGSEATFITERAVQALHSKRQKTKVRVTGLGGRCSTVSNYRTFLTLSACGSEFYHVNTRALILPTLTSYKQMPKVDHKLIPHLRDLQLADADPSNQDRIDLLIGADIYGSILLEGLRKGSETEPVAQRTIFGWVIFGPYNSMPRDVDQTTSLHVTIAAKSLIRLETRLSRDPAVYEAYNRFLTEYEQLGHMARITPSDQDRSSTFYMPHHPVLREANSTTPLQVVFNASSPTNVGFSLNDQLLAGPKLQEDLPSILSYVGEHIDTLLTVTYGQKPSPYLAKRSVKQLCVDEGARFPLAVMVLEESTYVDDALFGAYKQSQILEIRDQLNSLLKLGGFQLRKWASSHEELLADVPISDRLDLSSVSFQEDASIKALGLSWNPSNDSFSFSLKFCKPKEASKRSVLSIISRIFDPLGLIVFVVVSAKIFLQELWMRRLDWDTPFPTDLLEWWDKYYCGLQHLREISIPRWTTQGPEVLGLELHGFSDASSRAYAAVVYIRVLTSMDQFDVTLLICKTKVAPIKTVSIPRLELCAAALLARLVKFVQAALKLQSVPVYCWSDSKSILAWLRQHPSIWKTFVANRVSDIQTRLPLAKWGYVESKLNPADCASRGVEATTLKGMRL
ncbi:uncharacterized protein [Temnothorax nylanderi]|uniref:uncharacterized protein n=1 Tax=Temnothorax nylanderi TaxID=102681 RepID=UPI003A84184D